MKIDSTLESKEEMENKSRFEVAPHILQIQPYVPGKPEEELMRELNVPRVIKMASNENCFGPSPLAVKAMRESAEKTHRYPDGSGYYLRRALSEKLKVPFSNFILGNGSTDLVDVIARTYLRPIDNSITADQTFLMYRISSLATGASCITVPVKSFTYDLPEVLNAVNENTRLIFIANPNNPTGTMVDQSTMDAFLDSVPEHILVILDEAYIEYVERNDFPDGLRYLEKYSNVVVLRTFSKVYGLAGIRMGYAVGCEDVIANLNRIRSPFNTNVLAQAAALAALEDIEHVTRSIESNRRERAFLESELEAIGVPFVHSVTNFIFLQIPKAMIVYDRLLHEGIIVRPMPTFNMQEGLRVTIGRRDQNIAFLEAFKKVRASL